MPIQSYRGKTLGGRLDPPPPPLGIRKVKSLTNGTILTPVFCLDQYHFHKINGNLMLV